MTTRPKLIDFCCCQGGASAGYVAAGFDVYGIDIVGQPKYPYPFLRANAIEALVWLIEGNGFRFSNGEFLHLDDFAAAHGSPPCQAHTLAQRIQKNDHPDLIEPMRFLFEQTGMPWIIENVPGSPLRDPVELCGAMFGLRTYRHRLFESSVPLTAPAHPIHTAKTTKMGRAPKPGEFMHIVGNFSGAQQGREAMGMPWASRDGLREAIPPAYTEHVGRQLIGHLDQERVA